MPGPLTALDALLELEDDPLKQRREQKRRQDLRDLKDHVPHGHRPRLEWRSDARAQDAYLEREAIRGVNTHAPVCQNWPDRSHQPRGRLKGELHRPIQRLNALPKLVKRDCLSEISQRDRLQRDPLDHEGRDVDSVAWQRLCREPRRGDRQRAPLRVGIGWI